MCKNGDSSRSSGKAFNLQQKLKGDGEVLKSDERVVTLRWFTGDTLKRDGEVLKGKFEALHVDKQAFKGI